jgi:hypothetical protein
LAHFDQLLGREAEELADGRQDIFGFYCWVDLLDCFESDENNSSRKEVKV